MSSANGTFESTEVVDIYIKELDISVTPYVLQDTEPVLSLVLLVNMRFKFNWEPADEPRLENIKTGKVLECPKQDDVPTIVLAHA